MTDAEKHAVIGKAVSDCNDCENELRLLVAKAKQIGQRLSALGDGMQKQPFGVVVNGLTGGDVTGASSLEPYADVLDYAKLVEIEDEVRRVAIALRTARDIRSDLP